MKRFLSLLLVVAMVVSLSVCCIPSASAEKADKASAGSIDIVAIIAEYGQYLNADTINAIRNAYNDLKENGISIDYSTLGAIVGGLVSNMGDGKVIDPALVEVSIAIIGNAIKNGTEVDSGTIAAIASGLAGNLVKGVKIDPSLITAIISTANEIKEGGLTIESDSLAAAVAGIASSISDGVKVDPYTVKLVLAGAVDAYENGVEINPDVVAFVVSALAGNLIEGVELDPATVSTIIAAVADAIENGISVDSETITAIVVGLAGPALESAQIDPQLIVALLEGVDNIRVNGFSIDSATITSIAAALAARALEGTRFDYDTVVSLVEAIADISKNGFFFGADSVQLLVRLMVGNESYAQIRAIICRITGKYPFNDISASGYRDSIVEAYYMNLVNGFSDGSFRPNQTVTRAQFITMLWRAAGEPEASGSLKFADSSKIASDYSDAVLWGVQNGIIAGYDDNTFRPNQNISRAQMATFMYRYMKNVAHYNFDSTLLLGFSDNGMISASYLDAVKAICSEGIMNGVGGNRFDPNGTANRGMAATVILRMAKLLEE